MAINFPQSPISASIFTIGGKSWQWDGVSSWNSLGNSVQISSSYVTTASYISNNYTLSSSYSYTANYALSGNYAACSATANYAKNGGDGNSGIMIVGDASNSTIRCGNNNCVLGTYSIISGGTGSCIVQNYSTIAGGFSNKISAGQYAGILGGKCNNTDGYYDSFVIGSNLNANQACTTFVNNLCISGSLFVVSASCAITASYSPYNNSGTGTEVIIAGSGDNSIYQCGVGNSVNGYHNASIGGTSNIITSSTYPISNSIILGGQNNLVSGSGTGGCDYNHSILGGQSNTIYNGGGCAYNQSILSGQSNTIYTCGGCACNQSILGGQSNVICNCASNHRGYNSTILGGLSNCIISTVLLGNNSCEFNNSILGGQFNSIDHRSSETCTLNSSILGGQNNKICTGGGNSLNNSILGGSGSIICNGINSSILGGHNNLISNLCDTFIVGSNISATTAFCTTYVNSIVLQSYTTPPASPSVGMLIYSGSTMNKLFYYNGSGWVCTGS